MVPGMRLCCLLLSLCVVGVFFLGSIVGFFLIKLYLSFSPFAGNFFEFVILLLSSVGLDGIFVSILWLVSSVYRLFSVFE